MVKVSTEYLTNVSELNFSKNRALQDATSRNLETSRANLQRIFKGVSNSYIEQHKKSQCSYRK